MNISIHALVKRATKLLCFLRYARFISIHALVKRATHAATDKALDAMISIHALVKRATCGYFRRKQDRNNFNPRPREEGDLTKKAGIALARISIHALVKRATYYFPPNFQLAVISIHALVKRATYVTVEGKFTIVLFQSTPS